MDNSADHVDAVSRNLICDYDFHRAKAAELRRRAFRHALMKLGLSIAGLTGAPQQASHRAASGIPNGQRRAAG